MSAELPRIFWNHENYAKLWRIGDDARALCLRIVKHLLGSHPVLDLGCGESILTHDSPGVFIDIEPRDHGPTAIKEDIRNVSAYKDKIQPDSVACMIDVVEHLTRADALDLITALRQHVTGFLIFSPVGSHSVSDLAGPHTHRSAWEPFEFVHAGWNVIEMPTFHRYHDGYIHGAFFAWTGIDHTAQQINHLCFMRKEPL